MSEIAIRAVGIGKRYAIGQRAHYRALRDVISGALKSPARLLGYTRPNGAHSRENIWALRDISFDLHEGEVVGLIGRNGAGKSTLLKILARITRPTLGFAEVHGRMGSLLEVGTGFHPELSGRENVWLSGAILGMSRSDIQRRFDEIVEFAEVRQFIDTPLKHYSSGMQMRLAFAVAAHLEPEILLVDEVLAVGDAAFQKKCLGKMGEVASTGRTIVLVSHQMNQIRRLCERVIWLDGGKIRQAGPTALTLAAYEASFSANSDNGSRLPPSDNLKTQFLGWKITDPVSEHTHCLGSLGPVTVEFSVKVGTKISHGHHGIALRSAEGQLMWAWATSSLALDPGVQALRYVFPTLPLRPGIYSWHVTLYDDNGLLDEWMGAPDMIIATENHQHALDEWNGVLNLPSAFDVQSQRSNDN